jgi:hypothetical protein
MAMQFDAIASSGDGEPTGGTFKLLANALGLRVLVDAQVADSSEASLDTDLRNAMHGQKSDHLLTVGDSDEEVLILVVQQMGKFSAHERLRNQISQLGEQTADCERIGKRCLANRDLIGPVQSDGQFYFLPMAETQA